MWSEESLQRQPGKKLNSILLKDLTNILTEATKYGIVVEPVANNIYEWDVLFMDFPSDSVLGLDLVQIKQRFKYNYFQIRVNFDMDLYPVFFSLISCAYLI